MSRVKPEQLRARAEALEECAGHLDLDWTDDATERQEGARLAEQLRAEARQVSRRAAELEKNTSNPRRRNRQK